MKYVIYCGPGIGDFILILPMAYTIKKNDPAANISAIMTSDRNRIEITRQLMDFQTAIDYLDYYSVHEYRHMLSFFLHFGFHKYDYGFVLQYTDNIATSQWPSRIIHFAAETTCGIKLKYRPKVKYDYEISRNSKYHITDYPAMMLKQIGMKQFVNLNNESLLDRVKIEKYFESLRLITQKDVFTVSLVMGTAAVSGNIQGTFFSNMTKSWPYENWFQLAGLFKKSGCRVFLLGGKKEEEELRSWELADKLACDNLAGKCTIIQSMAVLCKSNIAIGADTGLMHCAGALGVPSLTLYGCTSPDEYLPVGRLSYWIKSEMPCSPCFGTDDALLCREKLCMRNITVESVYEKALEILHNLQ